jgi:hypothetical protein
LRPGLILDTAKLTVPQCVRLLIARLTKHGWLV